jgi:hypothetical protein
VDPRRAGGAIGRRRAGLLRQLLQDHLDLRAHRETRVEIVDADGTTHGAVGAGHTRRLTTVLGDVCVTRLVYRRRGHPNLPSPTRR